MHPVLNAWSRERRLCLDLRWHVVSVRFGLWSLRRGVLQPRRRRQLLLLGGRLLRLELRLHGQRGLSAGVCLHPRHVLWNSEVSGGLWYGPTAASPSRPDGHREARLEPIPSVRTRRKGASGSLARAPSFAVPELSLSPRPSPPPGTRDRTRACRPGTGR